jgi:hypothetical protein
MKQRFFLFIWLVFMALAARPQKPEFRILFEGIGDNREFSGGKSLSQTILGTRGAFEAGTTIDGHRLRAGLSRLFEFGSPPDYHKAELILYYQFEDKAKTFHFGSFPRRDLVNFPLGMLTDTLNYYRPNIEGLWGEYRWNSGHQNIFIDWTGRQTGEVREAFTAAASGELSFNGFFFQNYLLLNHLAHSKPRGAEEHVNDNLGYSVLAGWRSDRSPKFSSYLKAGILGSAFRERSVTDGIIHAQSLLAEAYFKNGNFAGKATLHSGEGHLFMTGDPFYRSENYLRTDLIWYFINHKNIKGRFNLSFHLTEWSHFDQSQQISIIYALPNL